MGEQSVPESQSSAEHKAIGELLERAIRMGECAGASPEIKRLVARGVLNSATRVAVLLGVDLDTPEEPEPVQQATVKPGRLGFCPDCKKPLERMAHICMAPLAGHNGVEGELESEGVRP